jgi:hypothetical protein
MNALPRQLHSEHWIAFLDATKGSFIHRMLDGVLVVLLAVGVFSGAFAGFFLSQYIRSSYLLPWALGGMLIGQIVSLYAFVHIRCRILDRAFRRYVAGLGSPRQDGAN